MSLITCWRIRTSFPRSGRKILGDTPSASFSGEPFTAARTAACMCVTSLGTAAGGIGATTGWATSSATSAPRFCAQVSSTLTLGILGFSLALDPLGLFNLIFMLFFSIIFIMNKVIAIPKKLAARDDLVVIPKIEYEMLLKRRWQVSVAKLTPQEKRLILKSEEELAAGKYLTLEELEHELAGSHTRTRK